MVGQFLDGHVPATYIRLGLGARMQVGCLTQVPLVCGLFVGSEVVEFSANPFAPLPGLMPGKRELS